MGCAITSHLQRGSAELRRVEEGSLYPSVVIATVGAALGLPVARCGASALVALLAGLVPAWRASQVAPMTALRGESFDMPCAACRASRTARRCGIPRIRRHAR